MKINGKIDMKKTKQNIQVEGTLSWYFSCSNYRLYLVMLLSAFLNAFSQILFAYSVDIQIEFNSPIGSTVGEDIICFASINAYSLVLVFFSFSF